MNRLLVVILWLLAVPVGAQNFISKVFEKISEVDTAYIRPQEYNWAAMVQSTTTFETYKFRTKEGEEVTFHPDSRTKIGPYAGWRWLFLGYTFDVKDIEINEGIDIDLSFYTPIFNIDLMWKDTDNKASQVPVSGAMSTIVKGFNFNYVLSHKRFSYTAAFAQSSCQKRSAGSPIVGIGYLYHMLNLDESTANMLHVSNIEHGSLSFSGGYAYNYVPVRNLLIGSSLTAGIAFKKTFGGGIDDDDDNFTYRDFRLNNVNFDGCGRFALVYNNMKWFAGTSAVVHYYSYSRGEFSTSKWHSTFNVYLGFNFGRKK